MHRSPYHLLNVVHTSKSQVMSQRRLHVFYNHAGGTYRSSHLRQTHRRKCPVCGRVMSLRRVNRTTMLLNCRRCHFKVNLRKRGRQLVSLPRI